MSENKIGRPLKFKTVEEMQEKIDAYFAECDEENDPYTVTGLALALGFTNRQSLINYEGKEEFVDTVKMAKLRCENFAEKTLFNGKNAGGSIFALKNYGWVDRQEIIQTNNNSNDLTDEEREQRLKELMDKVGDADKTK